MLGWVVDEVSACLDEADSSGTSATVSCHGDECAGYTTVSASLWYYKRVGQIEFEKILFSVRVVTWTYQRTLQLTSDTLTYQRQ